MMKRHEEFERILASYREATPEEQAAAQVHMKDCTPCTARYQSYLKVDAALAALPQPALPPRLARPLGAVFADATRPSKSRPSQGFTLRSFAPAGLVVFIVVALSMVLWSVGTVKPQATTTPTLTMTLTPTTISTARLTEPATSAAWSPNGSHAFGAAVTPGDPRPTPAPAPAPSAGHSASLFVTYGARARITN
jgi:hypothetical protein